MATTAIKYIPKNTAAGTQYREIDDADKASVLNSLIEILAIMSELDTQRDEDSIWVRDQWWHKRTQRLHKGKNGPNSPCSTIGGIVHNFMYKDPLQRDFSDKQMEDIETITNILHNIYPQIPAYRFQIGFE